MRTKINYQINEKHIMKKIELCYLQSLNKTTKIENMKQKIYKQQKEELKKRLEDLTQAIGMLKTPNSEMTQRSNKIFINEYYNKPPRENYVTNKTDVFHIDNIWSLHILDLKD